MQIIGNGGHAKVVREAIFAAMRYGCGEKEYLIAIGNNADRKREAENCESEGLTAVWPVAHPSAIVSKNAYIGGGSIVLEGAVVQAGARIGRNCIINAGAVVTHDCVIGDYAHIAPGAHLCGGVHVGEGALVGVGVGIEPNVRIPAWSIVKREAYTICPMK